MGVANGSLVRERPAFLVTYTNMADDDDIDDLDWVEFDPDDAPGVLTTPNLCALFGGCHRCRGWATVAATGLAFPAQQAFCRVPACGCMLAMP
jgi:hypothetical protein